MFKNLRSGFTIIELLITVAIVAVLMLFASISYISLRQRAALNSTVDELVGAARAVQGWAIAGQDGTPTQCLSVSATEIKSPCGCSGSACKLQTNILSGVTITPAGDVNFSRLTGIPAAAVTFTISTGSLTPKTVVIGLNGKISS